MGESETWRVKDASGAVHEVPAPIKGVMGPWWYCEVSHGGAARGAVVAWCERDDGLRTRIDWREIAEPGQLFASEQVAAMFARCRKIVWEETEYAHNVACRALEKLDKMEVDQ